MTATDTADLDALATLLATETHPHDTPGDLARSLWPKTVSTPALDLIDTELARLHDAPDSRLIVTMPPQEGKSTRVARDFPLWWLQRHSQTRIVVASYGQGLANRNGRSIRSAIQTHPSLGLVLAADNGSVADWSLTKGGGVFSVGVGGGLTGRPADLVVIDDPIKDHKEADSQTFRDNVWDWWTSVVSTRLAPGAPVVVVLTRWHQSDLAGRLLEQDESEWRLLNIPAQADHWPEKGETDPLGRQPGEFMVSARGRTTAQWERRKREAGSRDWTALYQGRPSPAEGALFKRDSWRFYDVPQWLERDDGSRVVVGFDQVLASWDMAFKALDSSDFVVGQVWGSRGADCVLLDQVRARMDFTATCRAVRSLAARWPQAVLKIVEDTANGPAVMASLARSVPGLVPETPQGSKVARAAAVSPLVEAGNVWLPSPGLAAWSSDLVEEAAAFPAGKNDDQVDCLTQALNRLVLQPLLGGEIVAAEDLDAELASLTISPY